MAKEKVAAPAKTAKSAAGDTKFFVIQQGRLWRVEESAEMPDLKTEKGERTKVFHAQLDTRAEAEERAKYLADHFQGEFQG